MNVDSSNLILLILLVGVGGWVTDYWQNPPGKRIDFGEREIRPSRMIVLRVLNSTPTRYQYTYLGEQLEMPEELEGRVRYFPLFVDRTLEDEDEMISVAVRPVDGGEELYVDRDDDESLRGTEPIFFPHGQDSLVLRFRGAENRLRKMERVVSRVPAYLLDRPTDRERYVDRYHTTGGGMHPSVAAYWHHVFPTFTGQRNSFYYVYPKSFRRGTLPVRDTTYAIGLWDVQGDGIYDSEDDRIYIDGDGNGRFEISEYVEVDQGLRVRGMTVRTTRIDPFGSYVYFERGKPWF